MNDDIFANTFDVEANLYQKGFTEGYADGLVAGKIEGRTFGMAKGFDKFLESGRLFSKSVLLGNRLNLPSTSSSSSSSPSTSVKTLPPLATNARLEKNVMALYDLLEPETLSIENTDEAVNDFDDRFKRAEGKVKIIDRMLGEKARKS